MTTHTMEGYVVKYDVPWKNGTKFLKGAFDECDGDVIPIESNFSASDRQIVGAAIIHIKEKGIYYRALLFSNRRRSDDLIDLVRYGGYRLGLFANHIQYDEKDKSSKYVVKKGKIAGLAFVLGADDGADVIKIDDEPFIKEKK